MYSVRYLFAVFSMALLLVGCSKPPDASKKISSVSQLNDANCIIGGEIGTISIKEGEKHFPKAQFQHFQTVCDAYPALEAGKIDAIVYDKPPLDYAAMSCKSFFVLPGSLAVGHIAVGAPFRNRELVDKVNRYIRQYRADGTYDAMYRRWIMSRNPKMPDFPKLENPSGKIVIGTDSTNEPMTFMGPNGQVWGFDIEFAKRVCQYLNLECEHRIMSYEALFPAAASGKIDLAIGNLDVTEERRASMLFSSEYLDCPVAVMIRRDRYTGPGALSADTSAQGGFRAFCGSLAFSFERTFLKENRWKLICRGLEVTVVITLFAAVLGTAMAFGVCAMRRSKHAYFRGPAKLYISLMQGTPMLVILMILYYVIFARLDINAVLVAVIGFAMNFAAYAGEMLRTGIDGVDKGQIEAAKALGFGDFAVFRKVVFPQAARRILPVYKGEFINMLKMTSIVGYIAIQDLTKMSDIIRSRTYEAFFPLIATAVIYFTAAHLLASGISYLEYRLDPANRKRRLKGARAK